MAIQSCKHIPLPKRVLHTDVGLAGGGGVGVIYRKGKPLRRVPEAEMVDALLDEVQRVLLGEPLLASEPR